MNGRVLERKKISNEQVEEIEEKNGRGEFWEVNFFLHNTKFSSFEELKYCIGGGFEKVLEGLYELFKFNLSFYNILKIKNIIIININLSFSNNLLFQKMKDFSTIPIFFTP